MSWRFRSWIWLVSYIYGWWKQLSVYGFFLNLLIFIDKLVKGFAGSKRGHVFWSGAILALFWTNWLERDRSLFEDESRCSGFMGLYPVSDFFMGMSLIAFELETILISFFLL